VVPVRVQPPVADTAVNQPRQSEPASLAVAGGARRADLLRGDEFLLGDECWMRSLGRECWC